jgi:hypothetical protein
MHNNSKRDAPSRQRCILHAAAWMGARVDHRDRGLEGRCERAWDRVCSDTHVSGGRVTNLQPRLATEHLRAKNTDSACDARYHNPCSNSHKTRHQNVVYEVVTACVFPHPTASNKPLGRASLCGSKRCLYSFNVARTPSLCIGWRPGLFERTYGQVTVIVAVYVE